MIDKPNLDKKVFNQNDFELLGWHDSKIYSVSFKEDSNSLVLNLDYIIKWVHPEEHKKNGTFDFWISPAILIFYEVYNWEMNMKAIDFAMQLDILHVTRVESEFKASNNLKLFDYRIECSPNDSEITIYNNSDFEMFLLSEPVYCDGQNLEKEDRESILRSNVDLLFRLGVI